MAVPSRSRWIDLVSYLPLVVYLVLVVLTFRDYGVTYDEDWQLIYGEKILRWFGSGFRDTGALTYWNLMYYGGFSSAVTRLAGALSPLGLFETAHLVNGGFALIAGIYTYKLARFLGGPTTGFLGATFLLLTPRFFGHGFNNLQDIPFAALFIAALYYLVRGVAELPRLFTRFWLLLGIAIGLALGVRIGGVLLIIYFVLALAAWLLSTYWHPLSRFFRPSQQTSLGLDLPRVVPRLAGILLAVCGIAYLVMLAWWPAAQVSPIIQPIKALRYATHFEFAFEVVFAGRTVLSSALPWYYLPQWFVITLPESMLLALVLGLLLALRWIVRVRTIAGQVDRTRFLGVGILTFSAFSPIAYTCVTKPVNYDEIRHFLFVIPPLAVLSALSLAELVKILTSVAVPPSSIRRWPALGLAFVAFVVLFSWGITGVDMVELHPYQYIYFNRLFGGGVAQASRSYETDYWGASFKEGVEWIVQNYPSGSPARKIRVASCLYSLSTSYFLPTDRFEYIGSFDDGQMIPEGEVPDLFLASPRWDCDKKLQGKLLHTISRQSAPLLYIIETSGRVQETSDS